MEGLMDGWGGGCSHDGWKDRHSGGLMDRFIDEWSGG